MITIKDALSAFPIDSNEGMTLRQWYAGLAMQGLLANSDRFYDKWDIARIASDIADVMLDTFEGGDK